MDQQNYNLMALRGDATVDDMEVCEVLGLDPKYAYTPQLNDVALQQQIDANVNYYVNELGMEPEAAMRQAQAAAAPVREEISRALAARKMNR